MMNQDTEKDQPPSSFINKIKRFFTIKPSSLDDVSVLLEDALSARLIDKEAQFIIYQNCHMHQQSFLPKDA